MRLYLLVKSQESKRTTKSKLNFTVKDISNQSEIKETMIRNTIIRAFARHCINTNLSKCYVDGVRIRRQIHCGVCLQNPRQTSKPNSSPSPAVASKYEVINEDNSPLIQNTAEEIHSENPYPILSDEFDGINLTSKLLCRKYLDMYNLTLTFFNSVSL